MTKYFSTFILFFISMLGFAQSPLTFNTKGDFKIIQFTDIHYRPGDKASDTAIILIKEALDAEKPDFVVFTGDLAWGKPAKECFDKALAPVIERKIPWAYVNGNHDEEQDLTREEIMDYLKTKPYCRATYGDKNLKGVGNYILEVRKHDNKSKIGALLYFMDSGDYNKTIPSLKTAYDWFSFSQVDWYRKQSQAYTKDNDNKPYPALAFFHIPLAEYPLLSANKDDIIGHKNEAECNGKINPGMFAAMREAGDVMGTFVGHDHDNDYIGNYYGIALAYGRYSGGNTVYNNLGLNGCRVINLKEGEHQFSTYIRVRGGEIIYPVDFPKSFIKANTK